jgi:hypothetical protein
MVSLGYSAMDMPVAPCPVYLSVELCGYYYQQTVAKCNYGKITEGDV